MTATERADAYQHLADNDPVLKGLHATYGDIDPFLWHDGGRTGDSMFAAMVVHIIGQQISQTVTFIIFDRLKDAIGGMPTPEGILALSPDALRGFGLSWAKVRYLRDLAERQHDGRLDIEHMDHLDDVQAAADLTAVKGIGVWSAEMFLIHQLHRPDILPAGDIGIRKAIKLGWNLDEMPTPVQVQEQATAWTPYRAYASALLWTSLTPPGVESDPKGRAIEKERQKTSRRTPA